VVKAFADILEAPGGVLLSAEPSGATSAAAAWNWPERMRIGGDVESSRRFWAELEQQGRILELDAYRHGWGDPRDLSLAIPQWIIDDDSAWVGVPLIHLERLFGLVLLAAPEYRRALDWEDFDLLRTAGRQAASSLAEAQTQDALSNARRFEEFNRRFAFFLHDI
jgi:GAF domain-containing protein